MALFLDAKIAVVGGSSGIGPGVAKAAVEKDATVVIVGRSTQQLEREGGARRQGHNDRGDMAAEADIVSSFWDIGAFDHLASTAGAPPNQPIAETDGGVAVRLPSLRASTRTHRRWQAERWWRPLPGHSAISSTHWRSCGPTRVNIVSPGWVDTPMFDRLVEVRRRPTSKRWRPACHRLDRHAADSAAAYIYAMESGFTTGETIHIDGGQRLLR